MSSGPSSTQLAVRPAALITAGARRVGARICYALAGLGYDVAIHYNSSALDANATANALGMEFDITCRTFQADFNEITQVTGLIDTVKQSLPGLCVLVNNASIFDKIPFLKSTPEDFDRNFNVHARAPYFLIQKFALSVGQGHIVNILDTNIVRNHSEYFAYMLSKKTLSDLTQMSARALAPKIRVNAIAPGIILPPQQIDRQRYEREAQQNLLQRAASPDDITQALQYLVKSEQVTGQCLFVDGGDHVAF